MIHHNILHEIKKHRQHESFVYPYYGKYSIAEIPPSVLLFFDIPTNRPTLPFDLTKDRSVKHNRLVFFFADGLGYSHFADYEDRLPFFHKLKDRGDVYPLTSVFPSTTAAALTSLHTGKTPQEHGLPEWTVYLEELDRISFGTLREKAVTPEMLYDGTTTYELLKAHGISSYVFVPAEYVPSAYSSATQRGATVLLYHNPDDLFQTLLALLASEKNKAYFFVHWGAIDGIEHIYGPRSPEHLAALSKLSNLLEKQLLEKITPASAEDVLFILGSDHGQANIRNEDIIYLNSYLPLESSYFRTLTKKTIYPTGAPHDVFLHVYHSKVIETLDYLRKELGMKAEIITTQEAVERGLFGLFTPSDRFLRRIGDILILPFEGYHIWYKHAPDAQWGHRGIHGGLSQEEMIVPFAVASLKNLL